MLKHFFFPFLSSFSSHRIKNWSEMEKKRRYIKGWNIWNWCPIGKIIGFIFFTLPLIGGLGQFKTALFVLSYFISPLQNIHTRNINIINVILEGFSRLERNDNCSTVTMNVEYLFACKQILRTLVPVMKLIKFFCKVYFWYIYIYSLI